MNADIFKTLPNLLEALGLDEEPMGLFYTDEKPGEGFSPKPMGLPTRAKEKRVEKHGVKFYYFNPIKFRRYTQDVTIFIRPWYPR